MRIWKTHSLHLRRITSVCKVGITDLKNFASRYFLQFKSKTFLQFKSYTLVRVRFDLLGKSLSVKYLHT